MKTKKDYIQPNILLVNVQAVSIMAGSIGSSDVGYGGDTESEIEEAGSRYNDYWDD